NPLGGGAGSVKNRRELGSLAGLVLFQSPRRWGGVATHRTRPELALELSFVSIPSEVGRGRCESEPHDDENPQSFVSIPSEVGRGRNTSCRDEIIPILSFVSIPSEVGRGRARISTWLASSAASEK